jgi:diacylglycerol kinase family enzyme
MRRNMKALIVHNVRSGFGSDAIFEFERLLLGAGDECTIRIIGDGLEPTDALVDAESFDLVVASGGDGTVANILYALRNRGVPTCVFPSGTANLLFSNIGNAPEPAAIAAACREGHTAKTDLAEMRWVDSEGKEHHRGFCIMAGSGYDADIMRSALENKPVYGEAAYFFAAASNLEPTVSHFTINIDGKVYERDGISCLVGNNATIQADIQVVPGSVMNDGMLEVIVLETNNAANLLQPLVRGFFDKTGEALGRPFIESFKGRNIRIDSSEPVPLEFDGELTNGIVTAYEVRVLEGANLLIVDKHSQYYK